jgi:hypothetical protein
MNMKKTMMLLVVMMMITTAIFAQHGRNPHKGAGKSIEHLKSELILDDNQYATIKGIQEKYSKKRLELKSDSTGDRTKKFQEVKALHNQREREIESVLTSEQKTKWTALKTERKAKHQAKMGERRKDHEEKMKSDLSLSDEQFSKLTNANRDFREKIKSTRSESHDKAELKKLKEEHEKTVKGILTDDQFKKWSEQKREMKGKRPKKMKRN